APHRRRLGGGDGYPPGHWPDRPRQCRRPVWTRTPPRRAAEPGRHNSGLEPAGRGASRSDAGRDRITAQPPGSEMAMNATTPEPTTQAATFVTRCRDGYDKANPAVRAVYHHGFWSVFGLLIGYTALPRRIDIVCSQCGAVFNSITDRRELAKFRYREPRVDE